MKFSLDKHLDVDLQYIFGSKWNVNAEDLQNYEAVISNAEKREQAREAKRFFFPAFLIF